MEENNIKPVNLKLSKEVKEKFKQIVHDRQTTMQAVLSALVNYYIINPEKCKISMEINNEKL